MNCFFTSLFRYRGTAERTPLEDFLSECFAYLLNKLDAVNLTEEAVKRLLRIENWHGVRIEWKTQFCIPSEVHVGDAAGKRPDLVGEGMLGGEPVFVLIENKVAASYTQDAATDKDQLSLYREYLNARPEPHKEIRLFTHQTAPPSHWAQDNAVYWRDVHACLKTWLHEGLPETAPVAADVAEQLVLFLEDNDMGKIEINPGDVNSKPAWHRLRAACSALGDLRGLTRAHPVHESMNNHGFGLLTDTNKYGEFGTGDRFFGSLYTPVDADGPVHADTNRLLWMGVLLDTVYQVVRPATDGIPEFSVGMAVWTQKATAVVARQRLSSLLEQLNAQMKGDVQWDLTEVDLPATGCALGLSARLPLPSILKNDGADLVTVRDEFIRNSLDAINSIPNAEIQWFLANAASDENA